MNIFSNKQTINYLYQNFTYLFEGSPDYPPILKKNIIKKKFSLGFQNEKINFKSVKIRHGKIFALGYVFKNIAYISDCSSVSEKNIKDLANLNTLIIDCLRFKAHYSHLNFDEVIKLVNILKPKKTILTNMHIDLDYEYLKKKAPKNIFPGYDGMKIYA